MSRKHPKHVAAKIGKHLAHISKHMAHIHEHVSKLHGHEGNMGHDPVELMLGLRKHKRKRHII